eukprot:15729602-Heterocapsa_arctica.AAC.1
MTEWLLGDRSRAEAVDVGWAERAQRWLRVRGRGPKVAWGGFRHRPMIRPHWLAGALRPSSGAVLP